MRILYGVQATGNGHISRARAMLPALKAEGIEVDFLFSGRPAEALFDMDCFGDYRHCRGFTFVTEQGRVNKLKTLQQIKIGTFLRDVFSLDLSRYDLILSDFEPVTAWAAKIRRRTCIGLAHQYALRYRIPGTENAPWLPSLIHLFTPVNKALGVHWHHFEQAVLPPLIVSSALHDVSVSENTAEQGDFVLVYLPFESLDDIREQLSLLETQRFRVYAAVKEPEDWRNLQIRPLCRQAFPQDLIRCSGVICNTGFGLCSEAIYLGKKLLTKPLDGQIEQYSNAKILALMGRADFMTKLDIFAIAQWLEQPVGKTAYFPDVATAVAKWLKSGCQQTEKQLADTLWQQTNLPEWSLLNWGK